MKDEKPLTKEEFERRWANIQENAKRIKHKKSLPGFNWRTGNEPTESSGRTIKE